MKTSSITRVGKFFRQLTNYFRARRENEAAEQDRLGAEVPGLQAHVEQERPPMFADTSLRQVDYEGEVSAPTRFTTDAAIEALRSSVVACSAGRSLSSATEGFHLLSLPIHVNKVWPGFLPYEVTPLVTIRPDGSPRTGMPHDFYVRRYVHSWFRNKLWTAVVAETGSQISGVDLLSLAETVRDERNTLESSPTQWTGCEFFKDQFGELNDFLEALMRSVRDDVVKAGMVASRQTSMSPLECHMQGDLSRSQSFISGTMSNIGLLTEIFVQVNGVHHAK